MTRMKKVWSRWKTTQTVAGTTVMIRVRSDGYSECSKKCWYENVPAIQYEELFKETFEAAEPAQIVFDD